ncbi:catecholate siderophore receptor [Paucibacter oligotrophus]|uniref:Catecholate siderophore receptor n=1 Tax=Roseateles oligotrophus TaxID=1769250 RepID=A0A840LF08_9BURK|nr:catecholate siderophore receptor [Roseateles oligotrophus]
MSFIKSRKHAAAQTRSTASAATALGSLLALSLPMAALAQQEAAPKAAEALPVVKAKASAVQDNAFKAETLSSPKFVKPLVDTPQTITVINKELIQQQATTTLSEAMRNTPGVTFTLGENGNTSTGDTIYMRGFDASTSIFVDGVRDLGGITRDTFNTEAVEVVKGPSGADNGRGNPNGYVNLASKKAQLRNFSDASLLVASASRVRASVDLNQKLDIGLPGAALRFNAFTDRGDVVGRDVVNNRRWGIAPTLTLGLGTATRATLSYQHVEQDSLPDGGLPAIGRMGWNSYPVYATVADASANPAKNPVLVSNIRPVDTSRFYGSKTDYDRVQADMFSVFLEHDFAPGITVRNTSRFGLNRQQLENSNVVIGTGTSAIVGDASKPETWTVRRNRFGKDQRNQILVNQTNLSAAFGLFGLRHSLSTGLELAHEEQDNRAFTHTAADQQRANLYAPSTGDKFAAITATGASTSGNTTTAAVYAFDTIDINKSLQLSAGLRYERYRTEATSIPVTAVPPATQAVATLLSKSDSLLSGKLGLLYKPTEAGSVYISYATSQKPPGSDNFVLNAGAPGSNGALNINSSSLDPQQAQTMELGTKWQLFDNQMLVSAAVFNSVNKNELARQDPSTGEVTQYGKKTVKGLELAAAGAISNDLQLNAGLLWMDSEFTQAAFVAPGGVDSQTGASLVFSPRLSFSSWINYKLSEGPLKGLGLGFGARYIASQTTQVNNGAVAYTGGMPELPSYWVMDAMASYEINKNVGLQFNANNLADQFYIASSNGKGGRYTVGQGRNLSLSLNLKF